MIETPREILSFFETNDIDDFDLLEYNDRKGRYCYRFAYGNNTCFLKWNDNDIEHKQFKESLHREINAYQLLDGADVTPALMNCGQPKDMLVSEYLTNAKTIRALLKEDNTDNNTIIHLVERIITTWFECIENLSDTKLEIPKDEYAGYSLFDRYLGSLFCSRPFEAEKLRKTLLLRNKIIKKATSLFFKRKIINLTRKRLRVVHGDFHANNILVVGGTCKIIDFENVRMGCREIELAYIVAQLYLLLRNNKCVITKIDLTIQGRMSKDFDFNLYSFVLSLYEKSIRYNPCFY